MVGVLDGIGFAHSSFTELFLEAVVADGLTTIDPLNVGVMLSR